MFCIREVINEDQTQVFALDYSKAFDKICWKLIEKALRLFGFGEYITTVVNVLFNNIKTCVSNAGFSSDPFLPSRGIRQGCCASPVLFVPAVELLSILARKTIEIKGITIPGKPAKISQYADDATFFLKDMDSLSHLMLQNERQKILPPAAWQLQRPPTS